MGEPIEAMVQRIDDIYGNVECPACLAGPPNGPCTCREVVLAEVQEILTAFAASAVERDRSNRTLDQDAADAVSVRDVYEQQKRDAVTQARADALERAAEIADRKRDEYVVLATNHADVIFANKADACERTAAAIRAEKQR